MSHKSLSALIILAFVFVCTPVWAQLDETDKSFPLTHDSAVGDEEKEQDAPETELKIWVPQVAKGDVGVSIMFGFLDLNKTILSHDQIIYKWVPKEVMWGDVDINGANAFNTSLRVGYNITSWFCLEGLGGFSVGDCSSTVVNRHGRSNEPNSVPYPYEPALGEYDEENRSLLTIQTALNAVIYPFNIGGDGKGRFHPYATAGMGLMWYSMNSNYSDEQTSDMAFTLGGGLRFLVDEVVSIKFEMLLNHNTVKFVPREYFEEFDEGETLVTIDEFPMVDGALSVSKVTEYESKSNTSLGWSIGVQLSF